jgi:hypothetical protein
VSGRFLKSGQLGNGPSENSCDAKREQLHHSGGVKGGQNVFFHAMLGIELMPKIVFLRGGVQSQTKQFLLFGCTI